MIEWREGDWSAVGGPALALRTEVFVVEQGVPADMELDEWDPLALHVLALEGDTPIATGRLLPDGHIGRVAVAKSRRRQGLGAAVMQRLMDAAVRQNMNHIELHAQESALNFYERLGFTVRGERFMEAGIPHFMMHSVVLPK